MKLKFREKIIDTVYDSFPNNLSIQDTRIMLNTLSNYKAIDKEETTYYSNSEKQILHPFVCEFDLTSLSDERTVISYKATYEKTKLTLLTKLLLLFLCLIPFIIFEAIWVYFTLLIPVALLYGCFKFAEYYIASKRTVNTTNILVSKFKSLTELYINTSKHYHNDPSIVLKEVSNKSSISKPSFKFKLQIILLNIVIWISTVILYFNFYLNTSLTNQFMFHITFYIILIITTIYSIILYKHTDFRLKQQAKSTITSSVVLLIFLLTQFIFVTDFIGLWPFLLTLFLFIFPIYTIITVPVSNKEKVLIEHLNKSHPNTNNSDDTDDVLEIY